MLHKYTFLAMGNTNDSELLSACDTNVTKRFGLIPDIVTLSQLRVQQLVQEQKQAVLLKNKEDAEHAKKMEEFKNYTNYLKSCSKRVVIASASGYNKTTCVNLNPYDEAAFKAKGFHVVWEIPSHSGLYRSKLTGIRPILFWGDLKKYDEFSLYNF